MKINIKFLAPLIAISLILPSCESMLDVKPRLQIPAEEGLKDLLGVTATLNAAYAGLRGSLTGAYYGRTMTVTPEILADNARLVNPATRSGRNQNEALNLPGAHIKIWGGFANHNIWISVNLSNLVYEAADKITNASAAQKAALKAQALFIRALIHFDLARTYGYNPNYVQNGFNLAVPIMIKGVDDAGELELPARSTTEQVFQQVEKDLTEAITLFGESGSPNARAPFFATRTSAQALLARLYLYWGGANNKDKYAKAVELSTAAIAGAVSLSRDIIPTARYVDAWGTTRAGATGMAESIFEVNFNILGEALNGDNSVQGYYQRLLNPNRGWGDIVASNELLALFETGDVRRQLIISSTRADGEVVGMTNKFPGSKGTFGWDNIPVIRTSEMYLTRAEANARAGNEDLALQDLNKMRQRAGIAVVMLQGQALIDAIMKERRIELAFEGHRWYDLTRLGQNIPKPGGGVIPFTDYRILPDLPIGDLQINTNLKQNPGY